ncbi:MAG: hypothetical protein P8129_18960 [Anaerolineae bacterium]
MRPGHTPAESRGWKQARQSAFVQDVLSAFTRRPAGLMSFEDVQQKLQLDHVHYLELQEVPLDQIAGSVGRYTDFTRAFFPRQDHLRTRWQGIEALLRTGRSLPPIELYKVGQVYFVRDGNHRVSVARQRGLSSLNAFVWEYETDVPLEPGSDVDELLCRTAHAAFVKTTHIDRLRPDAQIRLTRAGGYEDLLCEIRAYQQILSGIDRRDIGEDEALTLWYDIRYTPIVEIIRQRGILDHFPGRTEADLYLWLCRNLQDLEAGYGHPILGQEAAQDLRNRFGTTRFPARRAGRVVGRSARVAAAWISARWRAVRGALRH